MTHIIHRFYFIKLSKFTLNILNYSSTSIYTLNLTETFRFLRQSISLFSIFYGTVSQLTRHTASHSCLLANLLLCSSESQPPNENSSQAPDSEL